MDRDLSPDPITVAAEFGRRTLLNPDLLVVQQLRRDRKLYIVTEFELPPAETAPHC